VAPRPTQADLRQDAKLNLAEILKQFVGATAFPRVNPEVSSVNLVATRVFRNRPNRFAAIVINTGIPSIWWSLDPTNTPGTGLLLQPNGGTLILDWREDFEMTGWEQFLVADVAPAPILSIELVSE